MIGDALGSLFKAAFNSGLFQVNAGTRHKVYRHTRNPRLNRSRHWPYADSYGAARRMSPYADRPVR